jgi:hypothetical protein
MRLNPVFDRCFGKLYGKPCWNAKPGYGSFITFEFGEPKLVIREPRSPQAKVSEKVRKLLARRQVTLHGQWHLWIYCCEWIVRRGKTVVGRSSTNKSILDATAFLDGQVLLNASFNYRGCRSIFDFDLGGQLETKPFDDESEQWFLYEPTGKVLSLRADKMFHYDAGNKQREHCKWFPAWES